MTSTLDFQVRRDDLRVTRWATVESPPLQDGEVRLAVDRFAFSSNNITYAVTGDALNYWKFFPAPEGWGRLPVFGFANVVESRVDGVAPGTRFFGYLPMSSDFIARPAQIGAAGFIDVTEHRAKLPMFYNRYLRTDAIAGFTARSEGPHALLRPLFLTGFLIDYFLGDNAFFGASTVLIASASSKTALALAFMLARRRDKVEVVALTSPANRGFVQRLDIYERVVCYDDIASMPVRPSVLVDLSGSMRVRQAVHERLQGDLRYDCAAGRTHWEAGGQPSSLPGPLPKRFFAPEAGQKCIQEWGQDVFEARTAAAWQAFLADTSQWLTLSERAGCLAIEAAYRDVLEGHSSPDQGYILSLAEH
ncbi:DUF2855 family protein [Bradyrhizobium diazoefficiens]|nr:DUF2855 family protein [Bradyrhizobium diazoefficiens]MBR0701967.1 DUF2855 family protein [Bradyrhizobium diazoefficiens]MBR0770390.1 DUF2855 family protein [Bradyrhizobium diazoefficiens]